MAKKRKSTATDEVISDAATDQTVTTYASESNPGRRPSEPDIADVDPGNGKGELLPPLNGETFVVLDGKHKLVPKEYDGHVAAVISWPTTTEQDPDTGETKSYLPPKAVVTVKELSQGAQFSLPMDAFKQVSTNGRAGVLGFA